MKRDVLFIMNTWAVGFLGLVVVAISYRAFAHTKWQAFATRAKQRRQLRSVITVKVVVRRDGRERVRVFHRPGGSYGVAIDQVGTAGAWEPVDAPDTGAVFASAALALSEASTSRPWCLAEEIHTQSRGLAGEDMVGRLRSRNASARLGEMCGARTGQIG